MLADLMFMVSMIVASIFLLWATTRCMINLKMIKLGLPFFFSGVLLCFSAAISFYGIFDQKIWFGLEFSWTILFFWIFVNLRRVNGNN